MSLFFGGKNTVTLNSSTANVYELLLDPGKYKIECWGASGGAPQIPDFLGSRGAYVSGVITFNKTQTLFAYIGQQGAYHETFVHTNPNTFNGGGSGGVAVENSAYGGGSGGGATDIRLIKANWDNFESQKSRILVAAGGGGTTKYDIYIPGGAGGKLQGESGSLRGDGISITIPQGGGQEKGGAKCQGSLSSGFDGGFGNGGNWGGAHSSSGGGGGYFGGGGGGTSPGNHVSGAGGSSYISGFNECRSVSNNSISKEQMSFLPSPNHFSALVFSDPKLFHGNEKMPSPNLGFENGHVGGGFVRITKIEHIHSPYSFYNRKVFMSFISFSYIFIELCK